MCLKRIQRDTKVTSQQTGVTEQSVCSVVYGIMGPIEIRNVGCGINVSSVVGLRGQNCACAIYMELLLGIDPPVYVSH